MLGLDLSSKDWYQGVSIGWQPYVSDFYLRKGEPQRLAFAVAVPVTDNDSSEILAIIVVQPNKAFIESAMAAIKVPDGQIYVVDKNSRLICHSSINTDQEVDYSTTLAARLLKQGKEGIVRTTGTFRKVPIIAAYYPVRTAGWGVVIDHYESEILRPVRLLAVWISGFTLFFLGIGTFFAYKGTGLLATTDALTKKLQNEEEDRRHYSEFLQLLNTPYESGEELCRAALANLASTCDLAAAACHLAEKEILRPRAALGAALPDETGPFAREKRPRRLRDIPPESYLRVETAVGNLLPREILVTPLLYQGATLGVIEAASLHGLSDAQIDLLERLAAQLAISVTTLQAHIAQKTLAQDLLKVNDNLQAANEQQQAMTEAVQQMNAELQNRENLLREANLGLKDASRAKSEFLANMSHELRTPLNAIIGFSEILDQGLLGEITREQAESVRDIRDSGHHLLSLINDILDLSKVEAGKMELESEEVDIGELARHALVFFKEKALKHRLDISAEIDAGTGIIVADERKVRQVIINLLSNAVKFTPDGGCIRVRTQRITAAPAPGAGAAPGEEFVEVAVEDSGIGIALNDQKKLFQPFQQIHTALTKEYAGTGLGLSLCKSFVELHGGTIRLKSEPGQGSTFTFRLPAAPPAKREAKGV